MRIPTKIPNWKNARHNRYFTALYHSSRLMSETHVEEFYALRREWARRRALGEDVQLDHIVPLLHPLVCGLNVPWNLRIVKTQVNQAKGNRYWPDMPCETPDMFGKEQIEIHQMRLGI